MSGFTELEITLSRRQPKGYRAHFSFLPGQHLNSENPTPAPHNLHFRFSELAANRNNPQQYGRLLGEDLFADQSLRQGLEEAKAHALTRGNRIRMRLSTTPESRELQALHWETLREPQTGQALVASEKIFFSRTLTGSPGPPPPKPTQGNLKAVMAVANHRGLPPMLDQNTVRGRKGYLSQLAAVATCRASLKAIYQQLSLTGDLLFLTCRTRLHKGISYLLLEKESGTPCYVSAESFTKTLTGSGNSPRLVVLLVQDHHGNYAEHLMANLGPGLISAGIPSVLIVPDQSPRHTDLFFKAFFEELKYHGVLDRAVATARQELGSSPQYWKPALFLRTKESRLWLTEEEALIGNRIGPYKIERKLGQGGMGAVYYASRKDRELEMAVAVKLAHGRIANEETLSRFRRERQLLADLKHPHIAMLLDAGSTATGTPYVIMEHISGTTIDHWCTVQRPSLPKLLRLFRKAVAAVGFAHLKGVIHRDIKPANLMVTAEGEPKLLDFGIARLTSEQDQTMTKTGQVLMTPEYASPEQLLGRTATPTSDIYALGLVLLECLTGQRPSRWGCTPLEAVTALIACGRPVRPETTKIASATGPSALTGTQEARSTETNFLNETDMETFYPNDGSNGSSLQEEADPVKRQESGKTINAKTVSLHEQPLTSGTEINAATTPCQELLDDPMEPSDAKRPPKVQPEAPGCKAAATTIELQEPQGETVPEALGYVLRSSLASNPKYRFSSVAQLVAGLDRVLATMPDEQKNSGSREKKHDALVWYHPEDRKEVEILARHLEEHGLHIWLDVWALKPGMDAVRETGTALDLSHACLVCLGPDGRMPWLADTVTRDRLAFRAGELHTLPVLLPGGSFPERQSQLPEVLRDRVWTTFLNGLSRKEMQRLAVSIKDLREDENEKLVPTGVCPFRGLEVFREQDREFFFGREAVSQRIVQHLADHPFIGVLGPSGSGKSSTVRAGVIPQLRDSGHAVALMTPTAHPLEELAFALARRFKDVGREQPAEVLLSRMRASKEALHFMARELFEGPSEGRLCLVIDQFEEVFTLAGDPKSRDRFVETLCYTLDQPGTLVTVLLTMRSDFLGKNVIFPALNSYLLENSLQVLPMSREDLARAIAAPTRLAGLKLEPGLLDKILDDVTGASGELPLLEHGLLELYERRKGGWLTWQAYEEIGGIEGALARRAETEYGRLNQAAKDTLRKMFTLCLVHPGEGVEDTRRRATREELFAVGSAPGVVEKLLDRWMNARLLTGSGDESRDRQMVDVAHEALIRKWDRIRNWMTEDRETARLLVSLRRDARTWENEGRDSDLLLRGAPLLQMKDLVSREAANLGFLEKQFVNAGLGQAKRRKNFAIFLGCLGFVLAAIAFTMFFKARGAEQAAVVEKERAEQRTKEGNYNLAMMFDEKAGTALNENLPQEAWLYALAALSREIPHGKTLPGAVGRFADPGLSGAGRLLWTTPVATPAGRLAAHPEGRVLAMAGRDHVIRLVDSASGGPAGVLIGHNDTITAMTFNQQGDFLASGSNNRELRLWRISTKPRAASSPHLVLQGNQGPITDLVFTGESGQLAASSADGAIGFWDMPHGSLNKTLSLENSPIQHLSLSRDAKHLAYSCQNGTIGVVNLNANQSRRFTINHGIRDLLFTREHLAVACNDGQIRLLDTQNGQPLQILGGHQGPVTAFTLLPDSNQLASLGSEGKVTLWNIGGQNNWEDQFHNPVRQWAIFEVETDGEQEESDGNEDDMEDEEASEVDLENEPRHALETDEIPSSGSLISLSQGSVFAASMPGRFPTLFNLEGSPLATPAGHSLDVLDAVFSPDGVTFATASGDGLIKIWSLRNHKTLATLSGHEDEVVCLSYSKDGKWLASGSEDETLRLWSVRDGRCILMVEGHDAAVRSVAFSPNGQFLVSGSADGTVKVWEFEKMTKNQTARMEALRTLIKHNSEVNGVAFSPDGKTLASVSGDQSVILWSVPKFQPTAALLGHQSKIVAVSFSPDGTLLATGSDDRTARLWSTSSKKLLGTLKDHQSDVADLAFSPDGAILVTGSDDRTIKLWSIAQQQVITTLSGHNAAIAGIALSPDGALLVSASEDKTAKLWSISDITNGTARQLQRSTLEGHQSAVVDLDFSPDGKVLASSSEDQTVKMWSMNNGALMGTLSGHRSDVSGVAFSPDGNLLASASDDKTIKIWSTDTYEIKATLSGHSSEVIKTVFSPDGTLLASASDDQTIGLWNLSEGRRVGILKGHQSDVVAIDFTHDGKNLITASDDRSIRVWSVQGGTCLAVLEGHTSDVTDFALSPDGKLLVSASTDQSVKLWCLETQKLLATLNAAASWVLGVAWSGDGNILAGGYANGTLQLWALSQAQGCESATLLPIARLVGHEGEVNAVAFSPDNQWLASVSGDKTIRLWRPGDLHFFSADPGNRKRYSHLLERSLHHFGYRLDGFQMVSEPRYQLESHSGHRFTKRHIHQDLWGRRPADQSLLNWLGGGLSSPTPPETEN